MSYQPEIGAFATLNLPGEITRAEIVRVVSPTKMIAKLVTFTTSREHNYRRGDHVPCRLVTNHLNQRVWEAIPERELDQAGPPEMALPAGLAMAAGGDDGFVRGEN